MALYKLCKAGVIRLDGAVIPASLQNRDYKDYVAWINAGNVPDPADPELIPDTDLQIAIRLLQQDPVFRALVKVLATRFGISVAQLVNEIKTQV